MLTTGTIDTDGARLYPERRGDRPLLLLIPWGNGRYANFTAVSGMLAWDYTVLTYDRRGHARSRLLLGTSGKPRHLDGPTIAVLRAHQRDCGRAAYAVVTMTVYAHVLPGSQRDAADLFARLVGET